MSREGGVQNFNGHPWPRGTERASEVCVKSGHTGDVHILWVGRDVQTFSVAIGDRITEENIVETAPRGWNSEPEYYASIGRGWYGFDS